MQKLRNYKKHASKKASKLQKRTIQCIRKGQDLKEVRELRDIALRESRRLLNFGLDDLELAEELEEGGHLLEGADGVPDTAYDDGGSRPHAGVEELVEGAVGMDEDAAILGRADERLLIVHAGLVELELLVGRVPSKLVDFRESRQVDGPDRVDGTLEEAGDAIVDGAAVDIDAGPDTEVMIGLSGEAAVDDAQFADGVLDEDEGNVLVPLDDDAAGCAAVLLRVDDDIANLLEPNTGQILEEVGLLLELLDLILVLAADVLEVGIKAVMTLGSSRANGS
uniref:Uncharacterized protein n=1 Tax=Panagrellus redivivus TaxID=6233 RepID=A0A7E4W3Y6_PANRE